MAEEGTDQVAGFCAHASELGLSVLYVPEIISGLNRRLKENGLTQREYDQANDRLLEDVADADLIQLTPAVIRSTVSILERNAVRTLDAIHVASALRWEADLFVTSDKRQWYAAQATGLKTAMSPSTSSSRLS